MSLGGRLVGGLLAAAAVTVLLSAVAATLALADGASALWRIPFRLLCHGLPERSFTLGDVAMPLCARCVAIWTGLAAGALLFAIAPRRLGWFSLPVLGLLALPVLLDGGTQAVGLRESTNTLRAVTGLLAGAAFAVWALAAIERNARDVVDGTR